MDSDPRGLRDRIGVATTGLLATAATLTDSQARADAIEAGSGRPASELAAGLDRRAGIPAPRLADRPQHGRPADGRAGRQAAVLPAW